MDAEKKGYYSLSEIIRVSSEFENDSTGSNVLRRPD